MERKLESEIQAAIIRQYEQQGYLVVKIGLCNKKGFPDLMALKTVKLCLSKSNGRERNLGPYKSIAIES